MSGVHVVQTMDQPVPCPPPFSRPIPPLLLVNSGLLHSTNSAFTVQLVAFLVIRSILQSAKGVCPLHDHTLAMLMTFLVCMKSLYRRVGLIACTDPHLGFISVHLCFNLHLPMLVYMFAAVARLVKDVFESAAGIDAVGAVSDYLRSQRVTSLPDLQVIVIIAIGVKLRLLIFTCCCH